MKTEDGEFEGAGLDRLDLVRHAVRTIVATLKPGDRLALVTYSDSATTLLPLTEMSDAGKRAAKVTTLRSVPTTF